MAKWAILTSGGDAPRIHGIDERVSVAAYEQEIVPFYEALIRRACGAP